MWTKQTDSCLTLQNNQTRKNFINIKDLRKHCLNTNPHGDKSTTARFVVPLIPSHAENSKTAHNPKIKIRTQYKTNQKSMKLIKSMGGTPLIIQVRKMMSGQSKNLKIINSKIQKLTKNTKFA